VSVAGNAVDGIPDMDVAVADAVDGFSDGIVGKTEQSLNERGVRNLNLILNLNPSYQTPWILIERFLGD
jgi:hypothetical protein